MVAYTAPCYRKSASFAAEDRAHIIRYHVQDGDSPSRNTMHTMGQSSLKHSAV